MLSIMGDEKYKEMVDLKVNNHHDWKVNKFKLYMQIFKPQAPPNIYQINGLAGARHM